MQQHRILEFSNFRLHLEPLLLTNGTRRIDLPPKALQILALLVRHAGNVVTKDELLDLVWPDTFVEEGNLAVYISMLRKTIGTDGRAYIETIPKRGYVFTMPISRLQSSADEAEGAKDVLLSVARHYLEQYTPAACRNAFQLLRESLRKNARDGSALVWLADCHFQEYELGKASVEAATAKARELLTKAADICPSRSDLRLTLAKFLGYCEWNWEKAEEDYLRAIEIEPRSALARASYGKHLVRRGEHTKGLQQLQTALQLDPLSLDVRKFHADALFLARDYSGYMQAGQEGLKLYPGSWMMHIVMGRACLPFGDYEAALRHFRKALLIAPGRKCLILADIAYTHAISGAIPQALKNLGQLQLWIRAGQYVSPVAIAKIHTSLGNMQQAIESIEEACIRRDNFVSWLKVDSRFDSLRTVSGYRTLMAKVGV